MVQVRLSRRRLIEIDEEELEARVGDVRVEIQLENATDRERALLGDIGADQVRSAKVRVLVDTGARMLVLPEKLVEELGLRQQRTVMARYADGRIEERPVAGMVTVQVGDRSTTRECIVARTGSEPLLGQIELESMDLLVDCSGQKLVPNPESPLLPLMPIMRLGNSG